MGMDLLPQNRQRKIPPLHYTWSAWGLLDDLLESWGVDAREFSGPNDGDPIKAETCAAVADALDAHLEELPTEQRKLFSGHSKMWRALAQAGGCLQH